jgi:hypothetical protein
MPSSIPSGLARWRPLLERWGPAAALALITLAIFAELLFSTARVLSAPATDVVAQFLPWREFGFKQIGQGVFPLWNPHLYSGAPYFGGFQSALLYPLNWLHLVLPVGLAINWIITLQVFLAGFFTYVWARSHGVSRVGGTLAGVMFMCSGGYFLHIYAGHLPHLSVMTWTPLLLWSIDRLSATGALHSILVGALAAAMQLLGGHPQYVYYIGIAAALYVLILLPWSSNRVRLALGSVAIFAAAAALSAVQLAAGVDAIGENVRAGGLSMAMASTLSLHPENLLTLVAPFFLGDQSRVMLGREVAPIFYVGQGYLWELCLFVGVTGLCLGLYGLVCSPRPSRWRWLFITLALLALALGRHTPLYQLLYDHLPGYSSFRGTAKFGFLLGLFLSLLAGIGFDRVRALAPDHPRRAAWIAIGAGLVVGILALCLWRSPTGLWGELLAYVSRSPESYLFRPATLTAPELVRFSGRFAAGQIGVAAGALVLVGVLWRLTRRWPAATHAITALLVLEMVLFARVTRETTTSRPAYPERWAATTRENAGDYRVHHVDLAHVNGALVRGQRELWGYDPGVPRRYAELMRAGQGGDPARATQYLRLRRSTNVLPLYRCRYLLPPDPAQPPLELPDPMPHLQLVTRYHVLPARNDALRAILSSTFNPRQSVVLDRPPSITIPARSPAVAGTARIVGETVNTLEIEADLSSPAILVVTDNFARGWRVEPLRPSQGRYEVQPGNYSQQAVALAAGRHRFVLRYRPARLRLGLGVSVFAWLAWLGCATVFLWRRRRSEPRGSTDR